MPKIDGPGQASAFYVNAVADQLSHGRLDCPTCRQKAIPVGIYGATVGNKSPFGALDANVELHTKHDLILLICSGCAENVLYIRSWHNEFSPHPLGGDFKQVVDWMRRVQPIGRAPKPLKHTPERYLKDYHASCRAIAVSAEASACMSRRCLQGILTDQGYCQKDLAPQIEALLNEADPKKAIPLALHQCVDAIRMFGNFGAHRQKDLKTLEIISVEDGEAEWCIEIAENLMDHYFERPEEMKLKITAANSKFSAAGKPNIKS